MLRGLLFVFVMGDFDNVPWSDVEMALRGAIWLDNRRPLVVVVVGVLTVTGSPRRSRAGSTLIPRFRHD